MIERDELIQSGDSGLLDVFVSEEDKKGTDLLAMSNFFDVFIGKIDKEININTTWEPFEGTKALLGEMVTAIKSGFDISQMGMLVADTSHFSKEIVDGLKKGIYLIGESKEVSGRLRPAILDEKGRFVKFFTLKKAMNPTEILLDVSTLSMQVSLKGISTQIEDVGRDVKSISEFMRREKLSNKFIYARDRIMSASTAEKEKRENYQIEVNTYFKEADRYLMEGLIDLYTDVNAEVTNLIDLKGAFTSLKSIDNMLAHINEDMLMIPRYVGLRIYLFNFQGKSADANRVLSEYRYQLKSLLEKKIGDGKYTALEIIHKYYPYNKTDIDFWIKQPKQMLEVLDSFEMILDQKGKDIFYVEMGDEENE